LVLRTHLDGAQDHPAGRQPGRTRRAAGIAVVVACSCVLVACSASPAPTAAGSASPSPSLVVARPTPSVTPSPTPKPEPLPTIKRNGRNAIAFAPLSDPTDITVVGRVDSSRAWSTSKVLVVLAFIDRVAGGDPDRLTSDQRYLIKRALTESNLDALLTLRAGIPGGSGTPMTEILRSVGDNGTTAPDSSEGSMQWTIRNQIKFLTALHAGKVVSKEASRYVLDNMHPVKSESWGLGTIDASAFKGGWLEPYTETRQMGFVDDYAVAIITNGVGPAEVQIDGDSAHVKQMNKLARILHRYLEADQQQAAAG
jgi:hypothetical protein